MSDKTVPQHSEKYFSMKRHKERAQNSKKKTQGVARFKEEEVEKEPSDSVEENINSIVTRDDVVAALFSGDKIDGYPKNTLECLQILNDSKDLGDLRGALGKKLPGADLKPLKGKNKGVWQFRIDKAYRIRFELNPDGDGFINVEAGDFH